MEKVVIRKRVVFDIELENGVVVSVPEEVIERETPTYMFFSSTSTESARKRISLLKRPKTGEELDFLKRLKVSEMQVARNLIRLAGKENVPCAVELNNTVYTVNNSGGKHEE